METISNEIIKKSGIKNLVREKLFEKIVILNRKNGPGTIEEIIDNAEMRW